MKLAMSLALTQRLQCPDDQAARKMLRKLQKAFIALLRFADTHGEYPEQGTITAIGEPTINPLIKTPIKTN